MRDKLIQEVIDQIFIDFEKADFTALWILLRNLSNKDLKHYLPEEKQTLIK